MMRRCVLFFVRRTRGRGDDGHGLGANDMVGSYFGTQEGDFRLELKSISARKRTEGEADEARTSSEKVEDSEDFDEKGKHESEGGIEGLKEWLSGLCVVS